MSNLNAIGSNSVISPTKASLLSESLKSVQDSTEINPHGISEPLKNAIDGWAEHMIKQVFDALGQGNLSEAVEIINACAENAPAFAAAECKAMANALAEHLKLKSEQHISLSVNHGG